MYDGNGNISITNKKLSYHRDSVRCRCKSPQPKSVIYV